VVDQERKRLLSDYSSVVDQAGFAISDGLFEHICITVFLCSWYMIAYVVVELVLY